MKKNANVGPALVALLAVLGGCGAETETSTTLLSGAVRPACAMDAEASVELTLGATEGGVFTPIRAGDPLVIIDGRQGGTWVMPTLRLAGGASVGVVSGSITLLGGEDVGLLPETSVYAEPLEGGALEIEYVPIPIGDNPDGSLPQGIAGSPATVRLSYTGSRCERGSLEVAVVLEYEPTR